MLDTNTPHALVDSEYAARRASCEEAARPARGPGLARRDRPGRRTRRAARRGDAPPGPPRGDRERPGPGGRRGAPGGRLRGTGPAAGRLATPRCGTTSRSPCRPSTWPWRRLARPARSGARMTGGGFGGCIIALVPAGSAEDVADRDLPAVRRMPVTARRRTSWPSRRPERPASAVAARSRSDQVAKPPVERQTAFSSRRQYPASCRGRYGLDPCTLWKESSRDMSVTSRRSSLAAVVAADVQRLRFQTRSARRARRRRAPRRVGQPERGPGGEAPREHQERRGDQDRHGRQLRAQRVPRR